ncbi:MAG TPA: glycosyltransferase family 4 protein [Planctomycetota bacterium]
MRILQLNSGRNYSGEAAHSLNLTEALRQAGHQVWLGLREGFPTIERARARALDPIGFHMPHNWWQPHNVSDTRAIARLVRENKIDLIHAHRGKDHWLAAIAIHAFGLHVPLIRTRHVVTPTTPNVANRWLAKRTAAMVSVSTAVENGLRSTQLYPPEKSALIPGGIDLSLFQPATAPERAAARTELGLPENARVVVCVARLAPIKGHTFLLEAWKEVLAQFPDARLILVGRGPSDGALKKLAATLQVPASVSFLGRRDDVPQILSAADAGVLCSIGSEGFSRAVLEYMAKGLPVVASRVGAVPDLMQDGIHGALAAMGDAADLARALRRVLSASAAQRQSWGQTNRQRAVEKYSYQGWAAAHEQLYRRVLAPK